MLLAHTKRTGHPRPPAAPAWPAMLAVRALRDLTPCPLPLTVRRYSRPFSRSRSLSAIAMTVTAARRARWHGALAAPAYGARRCRPAACGGCSAAGRAGSARRWPASLTLIPCACIDMPRVHGRLAPRAVRKNAVCGFPCVPLSVPGSGVCTLNCDEANEKWSDVQPAGADMLDASRCAGGNSSSAINRLGRLKSAATRICEL
jgi:hypothetical protein